MKTRFSTYDLICSVQELQRLIGMRVHQVYDIDTKTYLIKLQRGEEKVSLLIESGIRIHTTSFEWPKNVAPSGFSMKMRKHIRNKRLEKTHQLGLDRIVDLQFGAGEAEYHIIVELYDRGNIILTDCSYSILYLLRPHTEGEDVKFVVRGKYPSDRGKKKPDPPSEIFLSEVFKNAKPDESIKKILNPHLIYGPSIIEHVLILVGISPSCKLKGLKLEESMGKFIKAFELAEIIINTAFSKSNKGYIIQKKEKRLGENEEFYSNQEFHPMIFEQHKYSPFLEFESFDKAVDEFFSSLESQKIDMKGVQQEIAAMKKLENVKKDHEKRVRSLEVSQAEDTKRAELIARNQTLVDDAIIAIRHAIANQMSWTDVGNLVKEATSRGDLVASIIKQLKLNINHISVLLSDPYEDCDDNGQPLYKPTLVDVDLDLSAYANAEKYYEKKRQAVSKHKKTLESQDKAFKSAEKKTKQTLKEVKTCVSISKARKVYWFEKFFWFISSENYLVIGGRDQQQNEVIVKRYMKTNDVYVHAGIVGASSVVIKNPKNESIPPKTLNEAGTMAICYSNAWEAKVVTSAWWVHACQVSKTAPTGEYLATGSFMIRGKKNFLPQCHLIMGFAFMFKLEDSSLERHIDERKKKEIENSFEETLKIRDEQDIQLQMSDDSADGEENNEKLLSLNKEPELYPDTEVVVEHKKDEVKCNINAKMSNNVQNCNDGSKNEIHNEDYIIYLGDDVPVMIKQSEKKSKLPKRVVIQDQPKINCETKDIPDDYFKQRTKQKRGQKSRLKKIKEKYKYQDEEEREQRMKILQGSQTQKEKKKKKGIKNVSTKKQMPVKTSLAAVQLLSVDDDLKLIDVSVEDEEDKEDVSEVTTTADVDMLNSLTGQPLPEDELLFAMPVVAPYNAIVNYKYKVKVTPGTGKRGRAARTALNVFLKEKLATQREKDLLKFVKDQDLARNFPGKVKISAPQLMKYKS